MTVLSPHIIYLLLHIEEERDIHAVPDSTIFIYNKKVLTSAPLLFRILKMYPGGRFGSGFALLPRL